MSANILAFDPGGSTGCALRKDGQYSVWVVYNSNVKEVIAHITPDLDEVVYERFATSNRLDHWGLLTAELCGAIQGAVHTINSRIMMDRELIDQYWENPHDPTTAHQIKLVRHEPANRLAFVLEAREMVLQTFTDKGLKPEKQVMDDGVSATAHLLCREQLGDNVRHRNYGRGISNV